MDIRPAARVESLEGYAFAQLRARVAELRKAGHEVVDFGVGDPTVPTPVAVREACRRAIDARAASGYPLYSGSLELRAAAARWVERRFGVRLDPETEVTSTIGSKEAICHLQEALIDPGDVVLCPSPGYPPYQRGARLAEGVPAYVPLRAEARFLPELASVPVDVADRAKLLWVCYPNAPTGRCAASAELRSIYEWASARGIVVASDEAYIDFWYGDRAPPSMLEISRDGVIAFFSLSKRSAMTGYRVGFACGDPRLVALLRTIKTNVDSGTPWIVEDAAAAALADEGHVDAMRALYRRHRDLVCGALARAGLEPSAPEGAIYVWQRAPAGMSSIDFARLLLEPPVSVAVTPGSWLAEPVADGTNPGEGYVRFALVAATDQIERAAERIARLSL